MSLESHLKQHARTDPFKIASHLSFLTKCDSGAQKSIKQLVPFDSFITIQLFSANSVITEILAMVVAVVAVIVLLAPATAVVVDVAHTHLTPPSSLTAYT